eukprot:3940749-Rhodomonas_salina.1
MERRQVVHEFAAMISWNGTWLGENLARSTTAPNCGPPYTTYARPCSTRPPSLHTAPASLLRPMDSFFVRVTAPSLPSSLPPSLPTGKEESFS